MAEDMPPLNITWRGAVWRVALIVVSGGGIVLADYLGWVTGQSSALLYSAVLVAIIWIAAVEAFQRRSRGAAYWIIAVAFTVPAVLRIEAERTRETAQWRIALMGVCATANPESGLAVQCRAAEVRADYEPCDFGVTAEQCRQELYHDAGWQVPHTPIPPHRYGETLPQGNRQ